MDKTHCVKGVKEDVHSNRVNDFGLSECDGHEGFAEHPAEDTISK